MSEHLERLFNLHDLLQRHGELQTHEVAQRMDVPVRTARDDLKALAATGRITKRGEGKATTWMIAEKPQADRMALYDAVCVRVGRDLLGFLKPLGLHTLHRVDADDKLRPADRAHLDRKLHVIHEPPRRQDVDLFDAVLDGLIRQRELVLHRDGKPPERVRPLTLVVHRRGLYLQCLRCVATDVRLYALDRLTEVEPTDVVFPYPPDHRPTDHFRHTFGVHPEPPEEVTLWFPADRAPLALARQWHPSQAERTNPDGSVELDLKVGGVELVSFVLSWGPACRVLKGERLRRRVVEEMAAAMGFYGETNIRETDADNKENP